MDCLSTGDRGASSIIPKGNILHHIWGSLGSNTALCSKGGKYLVDIGGIDRD